MRVRLLIALLISVLVTIVGCSSEKTQMEPGPFGCAVYLRGSFNGWGQRAQMAFADNRYSVVARLPQGAVMFKIGSSDWARLDLGAKPGSEQVTFGTAATAASKGANFIFDSPESRDYLFRLDVSDLKSPQLEIFKVLSTGPADSAQ